MTAILEKRLTFLLYAIFLSVASVGQSPMGVPPSQKTPRTLPFFINDRKDRPLADVKQSDLVLLDDKQPLRSVLSLKRGQQLPLRLGLLVDVSNSQAASGLYQPELKAASDLLNQVLIGPEDGTFIVKFSAKPEEPTNFMSRVQLRSYQLDLRFGGATALNDAVGFACRSRMGTDAIQPARRVLILLSDGDDNSSGITLDEVIAAAVEAGSVIFAVTTQEHRFGSGENVRNRQRLRQLAEKTGGEAFLDMGPGNVERTFSRIKEQIENMYVIAFDPPESSQKGFHSIELKVSAPEKARVRAPKGYYFK